MIGEAPRDTRSGQETQGSSAQSKYPTVLVVDILTQEGGRLKPRDTRGLRREFSRLRVTERSLDEAQDRPDKHDRDHSHDVVPEE